MARVMDAEVVHDASGVEGATWGAAKVMGAARGTVKVGDLSLTASLCSKDGLTA
jgi:hypothetical protein